MGEDEALYAACIGPGWREYYRPRFVALAGGQRRFFWNWPEALIPFWTQYRKLTASALLYVLFIIGVVAVAWQLKESIDALPAAWVGYVIMVVVLAVIEGTFGTAWLFVHTRQQVRMARANWPDAAQAVDQLTRRAPRRGVGQDLVHGLGSSLFALFGMVVTIVPLSAVGPYEAPHRAALKSDLRNLLSVELEHFLRAGRYTGSLDSLRFASSNAVRVTVDEAGVDGFRANAVTSRAPRWSCTVFAGMVRDRPPGANEGEPLCTRRRGR